MHPEGGPDCGSGGVDAADADDGDDNHEDAEAEEEGNSEFLAELQFDVGDEVDGDDDYYLDQRLMIDVISVQRT